MRQITACFASAAIAIGATAYAAPAYAADDIGSNPITELFDSFGLGDKEKPDIDYQERAPLVPPSSTANLPPPQAKGEARAGAAWPNDPDVQARADRKARDNVAPTETYNYRMDRSPRMDPDELGARRTAGAGVSTTAQGARGDNEIVRSSPDELQRPDRKAAEPAPVAASRSRLTDPPVGYMEGAGVTAQAQPEKKGFLGRMFGN